MSPPLGVSITRPINLRFATQRGSVNMIRRKRSRIFSDVAAFTHRRCGGCLMADDDRGEGGCVARSACRRLRAPAWDAAMKKARPWDDLNLQGRAVSSSA